MIIKNILRILVSYRLSLINIIFFELIYLIKGYRGNKFNLSNNQIMTDNIPCPYYFLSKINKILNKINFNTFVDLGCGSGRAIEFFNKNLINKSFVGIEYYLKYYKYSSNLFKDSSNIKIINENFFNVNLQELNADCYFLNHPVKEDKLLVEIIKKILNFSKNKKIFFIFINCNRAKLKELNSIEYVEEFYFNNNKGFSIYSNIYN
jgi:hypothetical protein